LDEKKVEQTKKSHTLNSYFTKVYKRDGGGEHKEKEKKGKGKECNNICFMIGKISCRKESES
jgi:hypothetical protein